MKQEHDPEIYGGDKWVADYSLNAVPRDESGRMLYTQRNQDDYRRYVSWLADYLFENADARSALQAELCRYLLGLPKDNAMLEIGMCASDYVMDIDLITMCLGDLFEAPWEPTEDVINRVHREVLSRRNDTGEEQGDPEVPNCYFKAPGPPLREETARVLREEKHRELCLQRAGVEPHRVPFCDIGWRIPLAVILLDVDDHQAREDLLDVFFREYSDWSSK